jgi:FAD/FMN-containing dehydrogenase
MPSTPRSLRFRLACQSRESSFWMNLPAGRDCEGSRRRACRREFSSGPHRLRRAKKLWPARHDATGPMVFWRPGSKAWATDVCVPIARLAECIIEAKVRRNGAHLRPRRSLPGSQRCLSACQFKRGRTVLRAAQRTDREVAQRLSMREGRRRPFQPVSQPRSSPPHGSVILLLAHARPCRPARIRYESVVA